MSADSQDSPLAHPPYAWKRHPVFRFFASLHLAVVLLGVLIAAGAAGTVAESRLDAKVARAYIYEAPWFNLWLLLLGTNLAAVALIRWPWRWKHTGFLLAHLGIILTLLGAWIGKVWGVEGTMALATGAPPTYSIVTDKKELSVHEPGSSWVYLFPLDILHRQPSLDRPWFLGDLETGTRIQAVGYSPFLESLLVPKPVQDGKPAVKVRINSSRLGQSAERWLFAGAGEQSHLEWGSARLDLKQGEVHVRTLGRAASLLHPGQTLSAGWEDWTVQLVESVPSAVPDLLFVPLPARPAPGIVQRSLAPGVLIRMARGGAALEQWVPLGWQIPFPVGGRDPVEATYAWQTRRLPFGVELLGFEVQHDEGTDTPASFQSHLRLTDADGKAVEGRCRMNHPANYPDALWRSWVGFTYKISQAGWDADHPDQSTVQIVRDPGWLFKWAGSTLLCLGIFILFYLRDPKAGRATLRTSHPHPDTPSPP